MDQTTEFAAGSWKVRQAASDEDFVSRTCRLNSNLYANISLYNVKLGVLLVVTVGCVIWLNIGLFADVGPEVIFV